MVLPEIVGAWSMVELEGINLVVRSPIYHDRAMTTGRGYFLFLVIFMLCSFGALKPAHAFLELNAFYFSEAESAAASTNSTRTFIEGTLGYRIDKAGQYLVGWGVASHSQSQTATQTTAYSSLQMGPRFLWMIDKAKNWSFGFAYYIVTKATYDAGGGATSETWKGSAFHFDGGYNLPISDGFFACLRLNYSSASYNEKIVGSTTYSTIGYSKTFLYPSIAAVYIF